MPKEGIAMQHELISRTVKDEFPAGTPEAGTGMKQKLRILHLEDNRDDVELIRRLLPAEGIDCELVIADTRDAFTSALEGNCFDVILADYRLPAFDGLSALEIVRQKDPYTPFIFVTGAMGEDIAIETLRRGATDYVLKSRLSRLAPAVKRAIEEAREKRKRREAEDSLYKINRTLKMLIDCNQALIRSSDEQDLLKKVCNIIVDAGGYRLAWVGYAVMDAGRTVKPAAQWGYEESYLETLKLTWADTERGRGPTGTAIRTGRYVVVKNILTDPAYELWRPEAMRRGYASSIAIPLITGDLTIGSLNIYAAETDAFDQDEINLLTELAGDLSFGVMTLRMRDKERKAEEALIAERQRLFDVLDMLPAYVVLLTADYHVPFANRFFRERFGESDGRRCFEYLFGRSEPCEVCGTYKALIDMRPNEWEWTGPDNHNYYVYDYPFIAADGAAIVLEMGIDITERKHADEELRRRLEELERFRRATTQREFRIKELKERVSELEKETANLKALLQTGCSP